MPGMLGPPPRSEACGTAATGTRTRMGGMTGRRLRVRVSGPGVRSITTRLHQRAGIGTVAAAAKSLTAGMTGGRGLKGARIQSRMAGPSPRGPPTSAPGRMTPSLRHGPSPASRAMATVGTKPRSPMAGASPRMRVAEAVGVTARTLAAGKSRGSARTLAQTRSHAGPTRSTTSPGGKVTEAATATRAGAAPRRAPTSPAAAAGWTIGAVLRASTAPGAAAAAIAGSIGAGGTGAADAGASPSTGAALEQHRNLRCRPCPGLGCLPMILRSLRCRRSRCT